MAVISALEAAQYLVWRAESDPDYGERLTNLKVQKLVYYAQGFHLAWYDAPLFDDQICAWPHGPVVPSLYDEFKRFGSSPIELEDTYEPIQLPPSAHDVLEQVFATYGQYSAWGLRNLTHEEAPWKETPGGRVIPQERLTQFFREELSNG